MLWANPLVQFVVMTDKGFFNASSNARKYLFVQNKPSKSSSITDVEYRKFFQPNVVKIILENSIKKIKG